MKVSMKVGGEKFSYDIQKELNFDPEYVFDALGEQPGKVTWWWSLVAMKEREVEDFRVNMDAELATIELSYRSDSSVLEAQYGKVTESVIKAAMASNDDVMKLHKKHSALKQDLNMLKAGARGFDGRGALLCTAGSAQKAEVQARLRALVGKAKKIDSKIDSLE